MLASYQSPTYTKPRESPDAVKLKVAIINKTIVPLNSGNQSISEHNSEYFIWRTKMDQKVRADHVLLEGKVFRKDSPPEYMPGTTHNCRCYAEEVPDYILVNDEVAKHKAFVLYLRKGIVRPILLLENRAHYH